MSKSIEGRGGVTFDWVGADLFGGQAQFPSEPVGHAGSSKNSDGRPAPLSHLCYSSSLLNSVSHYRTSTFEKLSTSIIAA